MSYKDFMALRNAGPQDLATARRILEQKGRESILRNNPGHIFTEAEKLDFMRRGFLQALADICMTGLNLGMAPKDVKECLDGASENMDRI